MFRTIQYAVLSALLILLPTLARASDTAAWRVIDSEGQVEMSNPGGGFIPASLSAGLMPGTVLRTGTNGRAVIENNGDKITVAPNSVFELPAQEHGAMAHVNQTVGTALYDMVPRGVDRFRVDTPYLAAVIKGTVFTVNVTPEGAAVEVLRGVVQVTNGEGQSPTLVYPGQTATVAAANRGGAVRLLGRPPASAPNGASGTASPTAKPGNTTADAAAAPPSASTNGLKMRIHWRRIRLRSAI
jgi:hypothetical protein